MSDKSTLPLVGGAAILLLGIWAMASSPALPGVLGLSGRQPAAPQSKTPIDAATLTGHPGLYYLDAGNLTGTLSPDRFSAYQDLQAEGRIGRDATLITDQNLPPAPPVPTPNPGTITGVKTGLGLVGGGTSGTVTVALNPGGGLTLANGQLVATLGDEIDLASDEVVNVLPITKGGTGLSSPPRQGEVLVGTGTGYTYGLLAAGDGLQLITSGNQFSYSVDNTVCRTSGNCAGTGGGIVGAGTSNYLPKFIAAGTLANSLLFDDGIHVGIGTTTPAYKLEVNGGALYSTGSAGGEVGALNPNNQSAHVSLSWLNDTARIRVGGVGAGALNGLDIQGAGDTSLLRILGTAKVGIATATPQSRLDVAGGLAIGSYAGVNAAPSNGLIVSGNVGIGTNNPTARLTLAVGTTAAEGISFGGDTTLYRSSAGVLRSDGALYTGIGSAPGAGAAFGTFGAGNTSGAFYILNNGTMKWGSGTAATDTVLYRVAANSLRTGGLFTADAGVVIGIGGTPITKHLSATATWDPPSVANATATSTTVTVSGAATGDTVNVGFSQPPADGMSISGWVSAANTVKVTVTNLSGSVQDLPAGTLRADIWQH